MTCSIRPSSARFSPRMARSRGNLGHVARLLPDLAQILAELDRLWPFGQLWPGVGQVWPGFDFGPSSAKRTLDRVRPCLTRIRPISVNFDGLARFRPVFADFSPNLFNFCPDSTKPGNSWTNWAPVAPLLGRNRPNLGDFGQHRPDLDLTSTR